MVKGEEKGGEDEGRLIVRDLGSISSTWLSQEFMLAYFEGEGISPSVSTILFSFDYLLKHASVKEQRKRTFTKFW